MGIRPEWEEKGIAMREKLAKEKSFKKQHLTFISNKLYSDFNTFLYMLQYEYGIIIDDSIIEDNGEVFIYHIKCSYNKALKLKVYKDSNNAISKLEILGVWYMKQVIYFEDYEYYENVNILIEELENNNIKVLDIIISSRVTKTGSKVTHTLIVESPNKINVEIEKIDPYPEIQGIVIKFNGGGVIEVWKSIQRLL